MEIGGYFGLDLPDRGDPFSGTLDFQSGRSALEAVLAASGLRSAWIPSYVCDTVLTAARRAGLDVRLYDLDESLAPAFQPRDLPPDAVLIYVNYFGLCQSQARRLSATVPPAQLVIDNCHALFAPHLGSRASIYSPRKFAGLPDGGLVRCAPGHEPPLPVEQDRDSMRRFPFLLRRTCESARAGYEEFNVARLSLNGVPPRRMSQLTARLLRSIDWQAVERMRRRNFGVMHERLGHRNAFAWTLSAEDVPLCYPLRIRGCAAGMLRERLAAMDIFVPTYWPDALPRLAPQAREAKWMQETLFLPLDQRMDDAAARLVCDRVLQLLDDPDGVPKP